MPVKSEAESSKPGRWQPLCGVGEWISLCMPRRDGSSQARARGTGLDMATAGEGDVLVCREDQKISCLKE